jgi:hypothetical protein
VAASGGTSNKENGLGQGSGQGSGQGQAQGSGQGRGQGSRRRLRDAAAKDDFSSIRARQRQGEQGKKDGMFPAPAMVNGLPALGRFGPIHNHHKKVTNATAGSSAMNPVAAMEKLHQKDPALLHASQAHQQSPVHEQQHQSHQQHQRARRNSSATNTPQQQPQPALALTPTATATNSGSNGSSTCGGGGCLDAAAVKAASAAPAPFPLAVNEQDDAPLVVDGRPMRIVVYSRDGNGNGRSFAGEDLLIERLQQAGAAAVKCCNYGKTTLEEQIALAYQADVVMGIHGAALAHAVFGPRGLLTLELKTMYGYGSTVFARISDSRRGLHAQVNVHGYWRPGGHKPIDEPLVRRILALLRQGMHMTRTAKTDNSWGRVEGQLVKGREKGDFIAGPSAMDSDELRHVLGPVLSKQEQVCHSLVQRKMKEEIGTKLAENCDYKEYCDDKKRR